MTSLKRLSGAKEVSQDDFSGGVATFIVKYDAPPVITKAAVQKEIGKYKLDKIALKVTGKPTEKNKAWYVGDFAITGEMAPKVAELHGKPVVVVGTLVEDDKGKQSLEATKVEEAAKK
jgi:hypothetical protein